MYQLSTLFSEFVCDRCDIASFSSIENLNAHQTYYCKSTTSDTKRITDSAAALTKTIIVSSQQPKQHTSTHVEQCTLSSSTIYVRCEMLLLPHLDDSIAPHIPSLSKHSHTLTRSLVELHAADIVFCYLFICRKCHRPPPPL